MAENYSELIPKLLTLAQRGEAKAQYHLGVLFNDGKGVPQDFTQAAKWYSLAANQGHSKAQLYLGMLYQKGQGVDQDYRQAAKCYIKAASHGEAKAQYYLGLLFFSGRGVGKNNDEAVKWLRKAAEQGSEEAKAVLEKILKPEVKHEPKPERLENISELYEPDEDDYNEILIGEPDMVMDTPKPERERRKINFRNILIPAVILLAIAAGIGAAFMFFTGNDEQEVPQEKVIAREVVNIPLPKSDSDSRPVPAPEVPEKISPSETNINIEKAPPINQVSVQDSRIEIIRQEVKSGKIPGYIFERGQFMINPDAKNIRVTGTHVRLRSEPDTKSKILKTMNKGDLLNYYGEWVSQNNEQWLLSIGDGNNSNYGWISGRYAEILNHD